MAANGSNRRFSIWSAGFHSRHTASAFRSAPTRHSTSPIWIRWQRWSSASRRPPIASISRSLASLAATSPTFCHCRRPRRSPSRSSRKYVSSRLESLFRFYSKTLPTYSNGRIQLSDAEFLDMICRETGVGLLLDIENLYLNASNHGFDPYQFLNELPADLVQEVHMAGGVTMPRGVFWGGRSLQTSHSHPIPDGSIQSPRPYARAPEPEPIVLERDDRLDAVDEILDDVCRIRARLDRTRSEKAYGEPTVGSTS